MAHTIYRKQIKTIESYFAKFTYIRASNIYLFLFTKCTQFTHLYALYASHLHFQKSYEYIQTSAYSAINKQSIYSPVTSWRTAIKKIIFLNQNFQIASARVLSNSHVFHFPPLPVNAPLSHFSKPLGKRQPRGRHYW